MPVLHRVLDRRAGDSPVRTEVATRPPQSDTTSSIWPRSIARLVVLIDSFEHLAPLDDWLRTRLLPRLPADALTVIAGRRPPAAAWRADPAWHDLLRIVTLRNLEPEESRSYLEAQHVASSLHDRLIRSSHGHPLALSLLVDLVRRGGELDRSARSRRRRNPASPVRRHGSERPAAPEAYRQVFRSVAAYVRGQLRSSEDADRVATGGPDPSALAKMDGERGSNG